jgi:alpha-L-fucosidase
MSLETNEVGRQHEMIGNQALATGNERTNHLEAQWFGNAGLGLFISWGISSVLGEGDLSWSMLRPPRGAQRQCLEQIGPQGPGRIFSPADYWAQVDGFTCDRYDPGKWLAAAKRAGFTYAVLTTKHHDGYALWPSKYGNLGTRTNLGGRDLVREYVEACRRHGLKVGLYFSMPDWYYNREHMGFRYGQGGHVDGQSMHEPFLGLHHEEVVLPTMTDEERNAWSQGFKTFCRNQLEELLTQYGKIDILWFDGAEPDAITKAHIQKLQPGIVMNDRMGFGDYITPEGIFPKTRPTGWWEECHVWNEGGWAYRTSEIYKPTGWVLSELARIRAWGGNFLLNMAPNAHGELPPVAYKRMEELAAWMEHSRESVENVTPGPWPESCNVPVTCRDDVWYLHLSWVWDGVVEVKDPRRPQMLTLLRSGETIPCTPTADGFQFELPLCRMSSLGEVVKVVWERA